MNFEPVETLALQFFGQWQDAGSRLFLWNLIASVFMISLWAVFQFGTKKGVARFSKLFLNRRYWWNRSTRRDYFLFTSNFFIKGLLLLPLLDFSFHISSWISNQMVHLTGDFLSLKPSAFAIISFTMFSFVWDDFLRFIHHYFMHKNSFLWRLHSVHHSAKVLTPFTLYRSHPLEILLATLRNSLSLGVSAGLFVYVFESSLSLWTIAGVNGFGYAFNFLGSNLRHSHVPLRFGSFLERIFISPVQHQLHHSSDPHHFNKNYGVSLSVWDALFGSLVMSKEIGPLKFGLGSVQGRSLSKEYGFNRPKLVRSFDLIPSSTFHQSLNSVGIDTNV